MSRPDEDMQVISVEMRCWRKIRLGLKPTNRFMCEMSVQSLFDQRNFYLKLAQVFSQSDDESCCLTFAQILTSGQVNHMLKEFHLMTASLNPNAAEELEAPA